MNASDVEITRLFTVADGGTIENNSPNVEGGVVSDSFELILQAQAGIAIGDSGASYTLKLTAFDVSAGKPVAADLFPATPTFPSDETFDSVALGGKNNWQPAGDGFFKNERYKISIGAGVARGDVFQYTASLISSNFEVVLIKKSNMFVLA